MHNRFYRVKGKYQYSKRNKINARRSNIDFPQGGELAKNGLARSTKESSRELKVT
jgi:hypothetical protein